MPDQYYRISDVVFCIRSEFPIEDGKSFQPFREKEQKPDFTVTFREEAHLPEVLGEVLYSNDNFSVIRGNGGFSRVYFDKRCDDFVYAVTRLDWEAGTETVCFLPSYRDRFETVRLACTHISLESMLLHRNRLVLHASLLDKGILFTGPSGIGKSTQAALWETYAGAEIINGDRPILGYENGTWTAYGSPYAGSSEYWKQKQTPVHAIAVLSQGSENCAVRLNVRESFTPLFSESAQNPWDGDYTGHLADLVGMLAGEVPVFRFVCRPDESAVSYLKTQILDL